MPCAPPKLTTGLFGGAGDMMNAKTCILRVGTVVAHSVGAGGSLAPSTSPPNVYFPTFLPRLRVPSKPNTHANTPLLTSPTLANSNTNLHK